MKKVALVLSGGGAKGAFQFMAEKYAREEKGYTWDIIAGVSVGALNGSLLAMQKYQRLEELWSNISDDQVYTGKMNFWGLLKLILGAKSVYGNEPLWKLIDEEINPEMMKVKLRVGAVSLWTGEYKMFEPRDPEFKKGVLASTAMPIIWPPLDISPSSINMVDGGVRNISPLGDVLDTEPDEIIIINCSPRQPAKLTSPLKNSLDIGRRSLEIAMNEIIVTDIREFVRINKNFKEAETKDLILHNENDKPYKYYEYKLIEPDEPLGDTLDFSRKALERSMKAGWEKAERVLK